MESMHIGEIFVFEVEGAGGEHEIGLVDLQALVDAALERALVVKEDVDGALFVGFVESVEVFVPLLSVDVVLIELFLCEVED